jgi:hypothetical protein
MLNVQARNSTGELNVRAEPSREQHVGAAFDQRGAHAALTVGAALGLTPQ